MKIQCSCGAKHQFEVTPEMADAPVSFQCPACGMDASEFVNSLVRQELGQTETPSGAPIPITISGGLHVRRSEQAAPAGVLLGSGLEIALPPPPTRVAVAPAPVPEPAVRPCLRHLDQLATEKCFVCSKPICPKCMEVFGYLCSPLCRAKANSHGLDVPVYENQKALVEARRMRVVFWAGSIVAIIALVLVGTWIWYSWYGSHPKAIFSFRFADPSYSGQSFITGKDNDQIVYLHGDTLARHDMKQNKQLWSLQLLDRKKIAEEVAKEIKSMQESNARMGDNGIVDLPRIPPADKLQEEMERAAAAELTLRVKGQYIWVAAPDKLTRYDWETGKPLKEVVVPRRYGEIVSRGEELVMIDADPSRPCITRVNLASGEWKDDDITGGAASALAAAGKSSGNGGSGRGQDGAGLPTTAARDVGKPMDPAKVSEQASHLSLPARLALPATLSASMTSERTLTELKDDAGHKNKPMATAARVSFVPTKDGFLEFSVQVNERRFVEQSAMKPANGKSVLNGNLTAGNTMEAASEILNEMQRMRGGDVETEDVSRYQVTIRKPGSEESWTGEVIGPPTLYPLKTVNVLAANKMIRVLDKYNKQLWSAPLTYNVEGRGSLDEESATYGLGPCVEHKNRLFVFDQGILTAFDLSNGKVLWRLPSVGIAGLFVDDKDKLYVNTTTASPDTIKYSRQIDVSSKVESVILKVDSSNGKVLWKAQPGGLVNYVKGKFVFTVQSYQPPEDEEDGSGFGPRPYVRIRRINPSNGHEQWEHYQPRAPLDVAFDKNTIRLVFKKEVQVLRFPSF
jgi:hypothetical protein